MGNTSISNTQEADNSNDKGAVPPATNNEAIDHQLFFMSLKDLPSPPELKDIPGAQTWLMEGSQQGVLATSILIADVFSGEGPPLHLHFTEEVQFLPECRAEYLIGDKRFTVNGPGVVHIPANTPHAFVNIGNKPVRVVAFFPSSSYEINWKVVGPNPLLMPDKQSI